MCLRPWLRPGCTVLHRLLLPRSGASSLAGDGATRWMSGRDGGGARVLSGRDGSSLAGDGATRWMSRRGERGGSFLSGDGAALRVATRWMSGRAGRDGGGARVLSGRDGSFLAGDGGALRVATRRDESFDGGVRVLRRWMSGKGRDGGAAGLISMANVTRRNFAESLEQLKVQLEGADFVAVDLEMTGVESTKWRRNLELDSHETRYQNLKHSAEKFAVWQCGVCPFQWSAAEDKWIAYPYNFFVFPRNELQLELPSRGFFAQTSSLEFLTKHRFDFNACIYDGISYLSHEQEAAARALVAKGAPAASAPHHEVPLTRPNDVAFVEKIRAQVAKWRDELLYNHQKWQAMTPPPTRDESVPVTTLRPALNLDVTSHYQARLVKQVIKSFFPDLVAVASAKGGNAPPDRFRIRVFCVSPGEDMAKVLAALAAEERDALDVRVAHAVGFRKVLDAIVASGVPVVGHNCILDMAHIHSKFLGALPATAADFSASLRRHFPCVVDTKYLLRAEPTLRGILASRSTSLAVVFTHICQGFADKAVASGRFYFGKGKIINNAFTKVAVEVSEEFQRLGGAKDTGLKHEAGFDAYMTGSVFAQACHLLQVDAATIQRLPEAVRNQEQGFAGYANLLALGWVGNMVLDLTTGKEATGVKALRGPTPSANRHPEHATVAMVWGFAAGSAEAEVRLLVQRVFNSERKFPPADITLLDESSAFVHFKDPTHLLQFLKLMQQAPPRSDLPTSFRAAPYQAYEHLCRSPLTSERLSDSAAILQLERITPHPSYVDTLVHDIFPQPEDAKVSIPSRG